MLTLYGQERSPDATSNHRDETPETVVREIHALTPAPEDNSRTMTAALPPPPAFRGYFSPPRSTTTMSEGASSGENFTTISREFNDLVIAGSSMENNEPTARNVTQREDERQHDFMRIHEERDHEEETNPLAIVPDQYPGSGLDPGSENGSGQGQSRVGMTVQRVKREEVEAKITAWQTAKLAKINNRFKREDAVINGWVNEQVNKANSWMKKIEVKFFFFTLISGSYVR